LDIQYLFEQAAPIPSHAIAACLALFLGPVQFVSRKGSPLHRYLGYAWVLLMLYVSISSFWIHSLKAFGFFSPIHILSVVTLWSLFDAIRAARQHNIQKHQRIMKLLYVFALVVTGLFTLLPSRVMHQVLFP